MHDCMLMKGTSGMSGQWEKEKMAYVMHLCTSRLFWPLDIQGMHVYICFLFSFFFQLKGRIDVWSKVSVRRYKQHIVLIQNGCDMFAVPQ